MNIPAAQALLLGAALAAAALVAAARAGVGGLRATPREHYLPGSVGGALVDALDRGCP